MGNKIGPYLAHTQPLPQVVLTVLICGPYSRL